MIVRARVKTRAKSPARVRNRPCQNHYQPCNRACLIIATLVTVIFSFHNSALSCSILNETFDMLQQQETLHVGYANLENVEIIKVVNLCHGIWVEIRKLSRS